SQSTQMSYHLGGGGPGTIQRIQKYVFVMRANRAGALTIPAAVMTGASKSWKTDAIKMEVKKGRVSDPNAPPPNPKGQLPDPFQGFPNFPGFGGDEDPFGGLEPDIPRSDSDLFLKAALDKEAVFVGEQVSLTLWIFSRVDLSSV